MTRRRAIRQVAMAAAAALMLARSAAAKADRAAGASEPAATMRPANPDLPRLPERLSDGSRVALPPMVVRQEPPATDRRPAYIGAGLVVMAVVLWWNRRRRDRFESDRDASRDRDADRDRDHDADDLHAAARGDPPDRPTGAAP